MPITPNDFRGTDSDRIEKAIAAAMADGSRRIHVPAVNKGRKENVWLVDRAIILPSGFSLILEGATIELAPGVRDNIVRNAAAGVKGAEPDRNIEVLGLGTSRCVLSGGKACHFDVPGDKSGWRTVGILLQNVDGFILSNFTMRETQAWAISMENGCRNGRVSGVRFENSGSIPNQDGVDVRKGCHDILIENITGYTGDDVVALTGLMAAAGAPSTPGRLSMQIGGDEPTGDDDIYNVTIRNVYAKCLGRHGIVRLLNHDGVRLHHVRIENVWNTAAPSDPKVRACIRIGDEHYSSIRRALPEELHDIDLDGLHWSGQAAILYAAGHGRVTERNVECLDEARPGATLLPLPRKVAYTGRYFFAPSPYVSRDWVSFSRDASLPREGYRLSVTPERVSAAAADPAGEFYALQTLRQLGDEKTPFFNSDTYTAGDRGAPLRIPCCEIEDWPAFRWRGMMLDEGRHFFGMETVKLLLDLLAYHKYNVFHWHLTEDQGWRLAIDKYPLLAKYAAVRPNSQRHFALRIDDPNGEAYGPFFYTKDQVREIVAYAAERHITIVPEIEIPGHSRAALAAYPEFSCVGPSLPRVPRTQWGIEKDVYCAGNDDAIRFLEDVLDEVCELFPGEFVHFGGDECPTDRWKACPKCAARAKAIGLSGPEKLQGWVTKHFTEYLAKKGKRALGWDEILECEIPQATGVMSWRGTAGAIRGASLGHDVVVAPQHTCYLQGPQGLEDDPFVARTSAGTRIEKVYAFDPSADIPASDRGHVLGSQACVWSECVWNRYDLEWKLWPRACALAEVLWSYPEKRDFDAFRARLVPHRKRLVHFGVNVAPLP